MPTDRTPDHQRSVTYATYLRIPELLSLQSPRADDPEHDELLFIVIHQTYELWFKTLLHEFGRAGTMLRSGQTHPALASLTRVRTIMKTLVGQVDILETMTPLQFESFRGRLEAASGFQSAQFRRLEMVLGRRDKRVLASFPTDTPEYEALSTTMNAPSIWHDALSYLSTRGHEFPASVMQADHTDQYVANEDVQSAVLNAYRTDPEAAAVLERLVDIDEGMQEWKYRHVMMVERTIGLKHGTGGSAGAKYLASTLFKPSFEDLWAVRNRF